MQFDVTFGFCGSFCFPDKVFCKCSISMVPGQYLLIPFACGTEVGSTPHSSKAFCHPDIVLEMLPSQSTQSSVLRLLLWWYRNPETDCPFLYFGFRDNCKVLLLIGLSILQMCLLKVDILMLSYFRNWNGVKGLGTKVAVPTVTFSLSFRDWAELFYMAVHDFVGHRSAMSSTTSAELPPWEVSR